MAASTVRALQRSADGAFFSLVALAVVVIVLVGFGPSYYFRTLTDAPPLRLAVHAHGLVFSAWIALFLVQSLLIRTGRPAVHRRLGVFGAGVAVLLVAVGAMVAIQRGQTHQFPHWVLAISLGDMVMFPAFCGLAIYFRRSGAFHKRFMLLATLTIISAAVLRWPMLRPLFGSNDTLTIGSILMYVGADLPLLAAVIYDRLAYGRVHAAYVWGGGALIASQILRVAMYDSESWRTWSDALVRITQ